MCDVCQGRGSHPCPVCTPSPRIVECPTCNGYGIVDCTAWDIVRERVIDVTAATYMVLPDDEEEGKNYCKNDCGRCPECWGKGKVEEER